MPIAASARPPSFRRTLCRFEPAATPPIPGRAQEDRESSCFPAAAKRAGHPRNAAQARGVGASSTRTKSDHRERPGSHEQARTARPLPASYQHERRGRLRRIAPAPITPPPERPRRRSRRTPEPPPRRSQIAPERRAGHGSRRPAKSPPEREAAADRAPSRRRSRTSTHSIRYHTGGLFPRCGHRQLSVPARKKPPCSNLPGA